MKPASCQLTVVIVHYNQPAATLSLLDTLTRQTFDDFWLLILDNHSDENKTISAKDHPRINQVIVSKSNLGYAGALNAGIRASDSPYLLLLNNDLLLPPDTLKLLMDSIRSHPRYGIICPVITRPDQSIEFAGYTAINPFTGRNRSVHTVPVNPPELLPSAYAHGAAMLVSRQAIEETGPFPEIYFLYYEELDWSVQVKKKGYEIGVASHATIVHKGALTTSKYGSGKEYFLIRNRLLFMRRNHRGFALIIFFLLFAFVVVPAKILNHILTGTKIPLGRYFRAIEWNLTHGIR